MTARVVPAVMAPLPKIVPRVAAGEVVVATTVRFVVVLGRLTVPPLIVFSPLIVKVHNVVSFDGESVISIK